MGRPSHPLNCNFTLSSTEAGHLWAEAVPMPPEANRSSTDAYRIRLSQCGKWVIRLHDMRLIQRRNMPSAEDLCQLSEREQERMRKSSIDVISCANVPSVTGQRIFTVSPWIVGLEPCPDDTYSEVVYPKVTRYGSSGEQSSGGRPNYIEIASPSQFSIARQLSDEPFFHDVDVRSFVKI